MSSWPSPDYLTYQHIPYNTPLGSPVVAPLLCPGSTWRVGVSGCWEAARGTAASASRATSWASCPRPPGAGHLLTTLTPWCLQPVHGVHGLGDVLLLRSVAGDGPGGRGRQEGGAPRAAGAPEAGQGGHTSSPSYPHSTHHTPHLALIMSHKLGIHKKHLKLQNN